MGAKAENAANGNSIMRKFIYGILVPLVVILIITGILLNLCLTNEIESLQENSLQTETESASRLINEYFENYISIIETTAALPLVQEAVQEVSRNGESFRESPYHDEIIEALVEIQKLSPEAIKSLYIADFTTSQYLRWDGLTPEGEWDITTRPYYSLVNEAKSTILTSVYQNVAGATVVSVSTPVFAPDNGKVLGSVNIDLGIDNLLESMNEITIGNGGYVILFDSTNKIISARDDEILFKNVAEAGFSDELVKKVTDNVPGNIEFKYKKVSYYGNVGFVDKLDGWCVLGVLPDKEYHQPITSIAVLVIVCFVLCIIILFLLCMKIVRKIIQPMKELSGIVGELAKGNMNVECTMSGDDEIGQLAEGIRVLVNRLQAYMLRVDETCETLEHLAYTDALTAMGSRMAFNEKLKEYSQTEKLACVVADVNNLKLCNDKYGHSEGDKIITDAADCICAAFDTIGTCYRIGGDEFCVLIPEREKTEILQALEQVKKNIEEKNEDREITLSVAFGYAMREGMAESVEELFNRSDEMMYDTKYRMKKEFSVYREEKISNYLKVLKILRKSTDNYLFLWDIGRDELWFFDDVEREYAVHISEKPTITAKDMERFIHPADYQMFSEELKKIAEGTKQEHNLNCRWINKAGETVWMNWRGQVITDDEGKSFCMIGEISDQMLRYLYNPLTKLFNNEKMSQDFEEGNISNGYFMLVSIDNLNNINLEHGRSYGDQIIKKCAEVMEHNSLIQHIWHTEGNCFALDLAAETENEAKRIYNNLSAELADVCTISAGAVPDKEEVFEYIHDLYACAELTLEKAKANGKSTLLFFAKEDMEERKKAMQLLEELHRSAANGCKGFYLNYQPLVRSGNYQIYGAEALLRYHSETMGEVYPDEFIPLLEQSKLIKVVGLWVLETALRQCSYWRQWLPKFHVNVNFSVVQLSENDIAQQVIEILEKTRMPGEALTIELTENIQLHGIQYLNEIFKVWRDAGIELSIDDFGTGYASMGYLKELNVAEIKIDRLFVAQIGEATYNYRLLSSMIDFAKNNNIRICCEGVEDIRELTVLEQLAPNLIQGYLFAKPCGKEVFEHSFLDSKDAEYKAYMEHIQEIYQYKSKMNVVHFDARDILRETDMGLWIIRISEEEQYYEMYANETMEGVLGVDKKYTPTECYQFWYSRIKPEYVDYVQKNVNYMMEAGKVVQLQYPWIHPELGEVIVRCSGIRAEDSDGMVTLKGYHRIVSDIEETDK